MAVDAARARSLFVEACGLDDPAERAGYLERECGGDAELRARVEALLQAGDVAPLPDAEPVATVDSGAGQSVLHAAGVAASRPDDRPISVTADYESPARADALIAGRYTLQNKIGEGGMGEVWFARQTEPVKRKVALKVIKTGMDSRAVLQRFEQERQALAMMDHPNIAKVLDAGMTPTGQPFFVMELVNGLPLAKFCDEMKLTPRARLELFVPICQAVQHAHQKGIVHRDLKPANILITIIDGKPVPMVIDFGVAKATAGRLTEETLLTQFGSVVGTLDYMSPEQAGFSGEDIDTRADIYSLGVILYELLTGLRPIDAKRLKQAALTEMIRIIREEEPSKPSTRIATDESLPSLAAARQIEPRKLMALLRGDLDWVVMKCLEKHRERRYETAFALSRDIQRYLEGDPVEACPPSVRYRMGKFLRRNRGPVLAASLLLLALVVGFIGTTAGLVWAVRERNAKSSALIAETNAKNAAKDARKKALDALRAMTDEFIEKQMSREASLTEDNKRFLRTIIKHFEGFAAITADDAESRAIRGEGYVRVGGMHRRLGEIKAAETAWANALAVYQQLSDQFPSRPEFRKGLASSRQSLGMMYSHYAGRMEAAQEELDAAIAVWEQLVVDFPSSTEFLEGLIDTLGELADVLRSVGRFGEAEEVYTRVIARCRQLATGSPGESRWRHSLATGLNNLGNLLHDRARMTEAKAAREETLALFEQLAADFPSRVEFRQELARADNNLGNLLLEMRMLTDAESRLARGRATLKQLVKDYPIRLEYRQDLALIEDNMGRVLLAAGRPSDAARAHADAIALWKQLNADFPNQPDLRDGLAFSLLNLARVCMGERDFQKSKTYLAEAEPHFAATISANPRNPGYRQGYYLYLTALTQTKAGLGDQDGALVTSHRLRDLAWGPASDAYQAACALSLCIPAVDTNRHADQSQRQAAVRFYGDHALTMLRDAVSKGWTDAAHMRTDTDLDAVRERDDFKKLLDELGKRSAGDQRVVPGSRSGSE
jgi:serine/threonine protein kinase